MTTKPRLSVIVVNWNTREVLRGCLASLRERLTGSDCETIVVDNGSQDGSPEMVASEFPEVRLLRNPRNLGFGPANNIGMREARGDFFLLLNSDARLTDDAPLRLVEILERQPGLGVAGPRLVLPDGRTQSSARRFPSLARLALSELWLYRLLPRARAGDALLGPYWDHGHERAVDWIVGACMLVRREVFEETGGFDPGMFLYGEEVEWCRRIRERGWAILYAPVGQVLHLDHQSSDLLLGTQGRIDLCLLAEDRLLARWEGRHASLLAPLLRVAGALLRLAAFSARRLVRDDAYGRDVRRAAWSVLRHYGRRLLGRVSA